jgi:hypothetical protein
MTTHLLSLENTEETQKVHKRDTVCKQGIVVETVNLAAILENGSEGDNEVAIEPQR